MKNLKRSVDGLWMLSQGTDSSEVSSTDGILDLALQVVDLLASTTLNSWSLKLSLH